jgi:hypothetical protein
MFPRITVPQNESPIDLGDLLGAQQRATAAGASAGAAAGATAAGAASLKFSNFFALMPGDNASTVAVGAAVQFPQNGPTNGAAVRATASTFTIALAGTYKIDWQVSVTEAGQLQLAIAGVGLPNTVVGRATGTSQIVGSTLITVAAGAVLSVINPVGNSTALTITPIAGGASAVSATLSIVKVG